MKRIAFVVLFLFVVMGSPGGAQAYSVSTYYNYTSWLNAISVSPVVENFEDTSFVSGFSITEINGDGTVHDGVYENFVDVDSNRYQIFNYANGMTAFGGWFDLYGPGGAGTSINVYINDDNTSVFNIPNTAAGEFYGFVADGTFTGVRMEDGGGSGIQETYYGIDVALAPVAPVPEPTTMLLLGLALVGIAGMRRKFRS